MNNSLNDFLAEECESARSGYVKFEEKYYSFIKSGDSFICDEMEEEMFNRQFKVYAFEKIEHFVKILEGFIHNSNGKITPLVSRLGLLEGKIEETRELPELRGVDRVFKKIVKSTEELMRMYEIISYYLMFYGMREREIINLKKFFDGFHNAVITDREIKHKVVFSVEIEDYLNLSVLGRDFAEAIYFLGESVFALVRGKDEVINFKISAEKGENISINLSFEKKPFDFLDGNLCPSRLQSVSFYKLFREIAENNQWNMQTTEDGIRIEI